MKRLEQLQAAMRERMAKQQTQQKAFNTLVKAYPLPVVDPLPRFKPIRPLLLDQLQEWEAKAAEQKERLRRNSVIRKKNQRTERNGCVYVVGNAASQLYKIGVTCRDTADARLVAIRQGAPFELDVEHTWPCGDVYVVEARLHRRFAPYKSKGEWFFLSDRVLQTVRHEAQNWTTEFPRKDYAVNQDINTSSGTTVKMAIQRSTSHELLPSPQSNQ